MRIENAWIEEGSVVLVPYWPNLEEMQILLKDKNALREFASKCFHLKTCMTLPPAATKCGDADAVVAARKEEGKSND